ncbi:MAG: hypothetical protein LC104_14205 [Bacteroidales bacterium]|nr:hypothetical protein [Bacteroidales bacterium]
MFTNTARLLLAALAMSTTASVSFAGHPGSYYPVPTPPRFHPNQGFPGQPASFPGQPIGFPGQPTVFPGQPIPQTSFYPPSRPVTPSAHHHHHFEVRYRTCDHEPWRCAGHFDCRHDADRVAHRLQHRGYEVIVVCSH